MCLVRVASRCGWLRTAESLSRSRSEPASDAHAERGAFAVCVCAGRARGSGEGCSGRGVPPFSLCPIYNFALRGSGTLKRTAATPLDSPSRSHLVFASAAASGQRFHLSSSIHLHQQEIGTTRFSCFVLRALFLMLLAGIRGRLYKWHGVTLVSQLLESRASKLMALARLRCTALDFEK